MENIFADIAKLAMKEEIPELDICDMLSKRLTIARKNYCIPYPPQNPTADIWKNIFLDMHFYYFVSNQHYELLHDANPSNTWSAKREALFAVDTKALLTYKEILCLVESGFSDGATAHFRTLFELFITANFIAYSSDTIANQFLEHAETRKNDHWPDNQYKWACEGNGNNSGEMDFRKMCKFVYDTPAWKNVIKPQSFRKFIQPYNFCCKLIHASPTGSLMRLNPDNKNGIVTGEGVAGLSVPCTLAMQFMYATDLIFWLGFDSEINFPLIRALNKYVDVFFGEVARTEQVAREAIKAKNRS